MSCSSCNQPTCAGPNQPYSKCYEARLSLGIAPDTSDIVGSLDGVPISPIRLKSAIQHGETNTSLKLDSKGNLVYMSEKATKNCSIGDIIPISSILSYASLDDLAGIGGLVEGGIASATKIGSELQLVFKVPTPIETGEDSAGFLVYVPEPNDAGEHYKLLAPQTGTGGNSVLIGKPDGTIEFSNPIASPLLVSLNQLSGGGVYAGTPATVIADWYFKEMGTTSVITNTDSSPVEVTLSIRAALKGTATARGVYAELFNGGSDYRTQFVEGVPNIKQELGQGGQAEFVAVLQPNQKAQFKFGFYSSASAVDAVIGNFTNTSTEVRRPLIQIRRLA